MNCLAEALGIASPTNGTLLALGKRKELYAAAASRLLS